MNANDGVLRKVTRGGGLGAFVDGSGPLFGLATTGEMGEKQQRGAMMRKAVELSLAAVAIQLETFGGCPVPSIWEWLIPSGAV